jgi:NADH-quinone oxidoreductase subunit F
VDLHLTQHRASEAERAAVDSVLRTPQAASAGAMAASMNGHSAALSHGTVATPSRDLLLPVLHAIQARVGWISPGAVNYVAVRMNIAPAEIHGVASFYGMFSLEPRAPVVAHVCDDIACMTRGADKLCAEMEKRFGPAGSTNEAGAVTWVRSPCLGLCERAPAALVSVAGEHPHQRVIAPTNAESVESAIGDARDGNLLHEPDSFRAEVSVPQAGNSQNVLLRRIGRIDPESLEEYRQQGGYEALQRAFEFGPERVVSEVIASRLLGRGGAAFPTGKKWAALLAQRKQGSTRPHYVICNADESEPGTFKDRVLMEGDPFSLVEGITIAAYAVGAEKGYTYIRGEYPLAAERMTRAIESARKDGLLARNILGRGFHFDLEVRRGAGAYICGEETALFNSIEGYRGEPRNKPPFPTQAGLFRQPTVVNNVETLCNIPEIVLKGGEAFTRIGTEQSTGTRLFCLSGHVARPGVYEAPFGTTLRELIQLGGGVAGNGRLQAVLLGGAAGSFVSPSELDTPLTFEGTRAIGATLGSGVVMLFDDTVDLKRILLRIAEFFRDETCGQCVPCRVGVTRQKSVLERLVSQTPHGSREQELRLLQEIAQTMRDASICGLGQTASSALVSALSRWSLF